MLSISQIQSLNNVLATFGWLEGSLDGSITLFINDSLHPRSPTEYFSAAEAKDVSTFTAALNERAVEAGLSALTMVAAVVRAYAAAKDAESSAEIVLSNMLLDAAAVAEQEIKTYQLDSFPMDASWKDDAVQQHPAIKRRWDWDQWHELEDERDRWYDLVCRTTNCEAVSQVRARLDKALDVLGNFLDTVDENALDLCEYL